MLKKNHKLGLVGLLFGVCLGISVRNFRVLELISHCQLHQDGVKLSPMEFINLEPNHLPHNSPNNLVLVGVMTAKSFLKERAKAVYETWGKTVPGRIAFFSSEGSDADGLPVIGLKGVDDRYPPQKKSFMMLHYMYEHFIDKFEWFIRADDDVYVRTDKLEQFLRSIDSFKPQFIGQAGKGNTEEFGLLSLEYDENFCMGGPGVILSRETLRRVAPHIPTCLKNLYSTHEDVEVGRCVQKFAGIPCTWNYEMQSILHHNSSGNLAFTGNLKNKEVHSAITLHPVKKPHIMYRLHAYMSGLKSQEVRQEELLLHRDISTMLDLLHLDKSNKYLAPGVPIFPSDFNSKFYLGDAEIFGHSPNLKKIDPEHKEELLEWSYISKHLYSASLANPKYKVETSLKEGLEDVLREIMDNINNFSRQRGRVIEFREILYGYNRVNSLYGQDLILDMLLIYKKYRGKKMTVPVRRHMYVQRSFTDLKIREFLNVEVKQEVSKDISEILSGHVKKIWNSGLEKLSPNSLPTTADTHRDSFNVIKVLPNIVFVLPLLGRLSTFKRFLSNYEFVCLKNDVKCDLLVALFVDSECSDILLALAELRAKYPMKNINYIEMKGEFSRGLALDEASKWSGVADDDVLFFIDVDIVFSIETLARIRMNTVQGNQVYFPIVFSEYNPNPLASFGSPVPEYDNSRTPTDLYTRFEITDENGFFREFGFGICAIFKSDLMKSGIEGFVTEIKGWGLEDVKFLEKIIISNKDAHANSALVNEINNTTKAHKNYLLNIFRAPDISLRHVFHPIHCDKNLEVAQYKMCLGTKANTVGSYRFIEQFVLSKNYSIFPVRDTEDNHNRRRR